MATYDVNFDNKRDFLALKMHANVSSLSEDQAQAAARIALLHFQAENEKENSNSLVYEKAYMAYKKWHPEPSKACDGPNSWESFFAGFKAALNV